jgi:hypothetical protein
MIIRSEVFKLDVWLLKLVDQIDVVSVIRRSDGCVEDAIALGGLRTKIREGKVSYEEAKKIFDKHAPPSVNS